MRIFYNNVFKNYFFLMLTLVIEEVIFRLILHMPLLEMHMLRIFLGINIISLICSLLFSFFGRIISKVLISVVAAFFTVYAIIQAGFKHFLGSFVSLTLFKQGMTAQGYLKEFINSIPKNYYLMAIPLVILIIFYIFYDYRIKVLEKNDTIDFSDKFDSEERKKLDDQILAKKRRKRLINSKINALVISIVLGVGYYFLLTASFLQKDLQFKDTKVLFDNPSMPNLAMNQFGSSMYFFVDLKGFIKPSNSIESSVYDNKYTKQEQVYSDYIRNIDDSLWEQLTKDEKRTDYKKLNNYFISQNITDKNDFTGMFKDKNLIVIMMESTNNIILNEDYFPNVYKLYTEGWSWENSYSPRSACATGNNELAGMTSLYTINNSCNINDYVNNIYPESIFNLFNNAKYTTSSYHNYTEQYYSRNKMHTNLGSGHYYGVQELGIPYSNAYKEWPSDVDLVNKMLDITEKQDKFMVWLTTASANLPYEESSELGDKYLDLFANTNYNTSLKRYMSKLKEFDEAIGALLEGLEEQGKLDDTVIVLYADHYPFGLSTDTLNSYFDSNVTEQNEVDKTPFIIYSPSIQSQKFSEYTSYINITPTLANLFGLDYDPRLYVGQDLLSKTYENRIIFADGSWKDKKAYYDAVTGTITYVDVNNVYTDEELKDINTVVREKISMSNLAIKTNYFNYLENAKEELRVQNVGEGEKNN